jgi:hypothetical protein
MTTVWVDTLVTLTDLRGEEEPREWRLATWPAQPFSVRDLEYLLVLTDAARVVIAWRGSDTSEGSEADSQRYAAAELVRRILSNAADQGPSPSFYGADCTLVVRRVPALTGPPLERRGREDEGQEQAGADSQGAQDHPTHGGPSHG